MNKKILITIVIFTVLAILAAVGIFVLTKNSYVAKITDVLNEKSSVSDQIEKVKKDQDVNGYLPSDLVKNFMVEVKAENKTATKLYLSKNLQNVDIIKELDLTVPVTKLVQKEVTYEMTDNESATVNFSYNSEDNQGDEANFTKSFEVTREEDAWKIIKLKNIIGE